MRGELEHHAGQLLVRGGRGGGCAPAPSAITAAPAMDAHRIRRVHEAHCEGWRRSSRVYTSRERSPQPPRGHRVTAPSARSALCDVRPSGVLPRDRAGVPRLTSRVTHASTSVGRCPWPYRAESRCRDPLDAPRMLDEESMRVSQIHASTAHTAHSQRSVCLTLMAGVVAPGANWTRGCRGARHSTAHQVFPRIHGECTLPRGDRCCSSCTKPTLPAFMMH